MSEFKFAIASQAGIEFIQEAVTPESRIITQGISIAEQIHALKIQILTLQIKLLKLKIQLLQE